MFQMDLFFALKLYKNKTPLSYSSLQSVKKLVAQSRFFQTSFFFICFMDPLFFSVSLWAVSILDLNMITILELLAEFCELKELDVIREY